MNTFLRIFVIYHRDIQETDAGGSRTVIMVNNYLAAQKDVVVYTSYKHLSSVDSRIIEIPMTSDISVESVSRVIREKNINVLLIPEGERFAHIGRLAVGGTYCKIITEFHSTPGYEVLGLWDTVIHNLHDSSISIKNRVFTLIKYLLFPIYKKYVKLKNRKRFQQACLDADRLVVLSSSYIDEYKVCYSLRENRKIVAIGNALSFKSEITEEELMHKNNTILIVSRLVENNKRLSFALKAWCRIHEKYPNWNMQIVGYGDDELLYRRMVVEMNLKNISFLGHQNPECFYEKASIFLMTSAYEGWPMVLIESLQKGCVPVCMDSFSAVHQIINNQIDGFIISNNNIEEFTNKIEYLINNSKIRNTMALNGISNCQRFSMSNIGRQWLSLLQQVVAE